MSNTLSEIKNPVQKELVKFETHFRESMRSQIALLDKIMYYVVKRKGKQIRPLLVFLSAKICNKITDTTYVAASLVELLHTASLVHDDVVDDAVKRRGFFSINALWKNKIAVLVGDYLLSRGLLVALENNEFRTLQIFTVSVKMMVEGELLQFEKARKLDIKEEVYYDIIKQKTASLIAAACSAGSASSGVEEDTIEKMRLFGENIGMAFQIKDDLFDYGEDDVGKPLGIDIKEKKMTLPLIYSLQRADSKTRKKIINGIKKNSEDKRFAKEVISFVQNSGGLEYAHDKMIEFQQKAIEILHTFPSSEARSAMEKLVYYITARKK